MRWLSVVVATPVIMWGVLYAIAAVPMQDYLMVAGISHSQLATVLLVATIGMHVLIRRQHVWRSDETMGARLIMVIALCLATGFAGAGWRSGVDEIRRWGLALLVGYLVYVVPQQWNHVRLLIVVLLVAPSLEAVFALVQSMRGIGPAAFAIGTTGVTRAFGTIGQPNSFAGYLNGAWPLAFGMSVWAWQQRYWWRWLAVGALLCMIAGLALSFSRGAWIGALAGLLVMMWLCGGRWRTAVAAVVLSAVLVLVGGWQYIPAPLGPRLGSATQILSAPDIRRDDAQQRPAVYAAVERAAQFKAGFAMWQMAPLTGVGPGSYSRVYPSVAYNGWWISRGHAHNAYMQVAAELGIIGLGAYLWLWVVQVRRAWRATTSHGVVGWIAIAACGTAVAVAVHECFEYLQVHYFPLHTAAVLALAGVVQRIALPSQEGEA
ncbi:MAG: O-antigen ligase family protein [Roseiflexaceae bacterium]|jgi:O-antigen ligase